MLSVIFCVIQSLVACCVQSKKIADHAQFLAQGLFPVTTNADEVRNIYMYTCIRANNFP